MSSVVRCIIGLSCLVLMTGCGTVPVAEDLSQTQATEIVALLTEHGISASAERETGSRGRYSVSVRQESYHESVSLLHLRGLPAPEEPSFAETVASKGFLPNSREIESLRVDRALASEIEEALESHPSVSRATVILRRSFTGDNLPSLSAVVERRRDAVLDVASVGEIIRGAAPGIPNERTVITVVEEPEAITVSRVDGAQNKEGVVLSVPLAPFLGFFRVAEGDLQALSIAVLLAMLVVGVVGVFLGYWYGYLYQSQALMDPGLPDLMRPARQLDRPKISKESSE